MNRTKILTWQRDRIPTWMLTVVMATAIALSLMWGVNPAAADTAPASTPTVAPTTVATVAPVATATPKATSGTVRTRAQVPADACPDGNIETHYSEACPLEMKLVTSFAEAVPGYVSGDPYRVGDVVKVEIRVVNHDTASPSFSFNGVSAHVDFDTTEVRLVGSDRVPVAVSATVNGGIVSPDGAISGYVFKNSYSKNGNTGQIDFEAGASGTGGQTPSAFSSVVAQTGNGTLIGTFYVRVLKNPTTAVQYTLKLRGSNESASDSRNSVLTGADPARDGFPGNVGFNVLAKSTDASLSVVETKVEFSLVAATPASGVARRVGDVVPVQIKMNPVTRTNYIDTVTTKITFDTTEFNLVDGPNTDDAGKTPIASGATTAVKFANGANAFGIPVNGSGVATNTYAVNNTLHTGTIELNITGTRQVLSASADTTTDHAVVIGTIFVRPLKKTDTGGGNHADVPLNISLTSTATDHVAGEKQPNTNFGPVIDFTVTTTTAAPTTVPHVLGTVGISLKAQSPLATSTFDAISDIGDWASPTFTVVDGRYLDVQVTVDAANVDSLKVNRMAIDITFNPNQLELNVNSPTDTDEGLAHKLAQNIGATSGGFSVDPNNTTGVVHLSLKTVNDALLSTPVEVARLRFKVKNPASPDTDTVSLSVGPDTAISQSANGTNLFVTDFYADPLQINGRGEFDHATTVTRQKPSSLQIGALLQGRRATSPASRFVQPVSIELRTSQGQGDAPVERHLTQTQSPASVKSTVANNPPGGVDPVSNMVYGKTTIQSGATPTFAVLSNGSAADPLADLEPGTYDVYIKGQSSIAVKVTSVELLPGQLRSVSNFVLREGDIDNNDVVNGADFSTFAPAYNTATGTFGYVGAADFNQSDFIDMLDFSLLASNFNTSGTGADVLTTGSSAVSVNRLRSSGTYTMPSIAMTPATTDYAIGDVVPVTVTLNPGSRPVDGAQIVVRANNGAELVGTNTFEIESASPLSLLFSDAVNAGRNLIELALGRSLSATVSGPTVLGTVNVRITGDVTGDLLTIDADGNGQFATMIAGGGENLLDPATYGYVAPVSEPIVSGPTNVTTGGGSSAPARASAPSSAAPRASTVSGPRASPSSMSRAISEDSVRGILSISVPGRAPVELRTGLATSVPDAFCPTVRHNTYIRLADVGIAGATFGVEPGGVLSWVSPDQAGCVNWSAISEGGLTFTKETIMQFQLARAVPGALLWVLDGSRNGELYEVDASGTATYITGDTFTANQDHFRQVWANVIPVSTSQVDGLASRGAVSR